MSANTERQTKKKCVLSHFLKRPGSVTARKSFGSEFYADGPEYVKARSPNLVRNRGREKSDDDEDRRPRRAWTTAVDGTHDVGEIVRELPVED